jgi:hypothetical protein
MKILAGLIRRELQLQANEYGHCALYEDELQRVWPLDEENRKATKSGVDTPRYLRIFAAITNVVIRVYDDADNVIATHEHKGDFRACKPFAESNTYMI